MATDAARHARFQGELLTALPRLRPFAQSLARDTMDADDLLQATVMRALAAQDRFALGTNMTGWLYTILRNVHTSEARARRLRTHVPLEHTAESHMLTPATQLDRIEHRETFRALASVPHMQRQALLLVGFLGCSYVEAATISRCEVGTIKSRVNRAKSKIADAMHRARHIQPKQPRSGTRRRRNPA